MYRDIPLKHAIDFDDNLKQPQFAATLRCPLCSGQAAQLTGVRTVSADGEGGWTGGGKLTVFSYNGGCGHQWEVCVGPHDGQNHVFARVKAEA